MAATGKAKDVKRGRKVVVKALCFANYEFSSVLTGQPHDESIAVHCTVLIRDTLAVRHGEKRELTALLDGGLIFLCLEQSSMKINHSGYLRQERRTKLSVFRNSYYYYYYYYYY